ncbi:MAG TPA: hypothetical protein VGD07_22925 [Methylomirabilota bacterium]
MRLFRRSSRPAPAPVTPEFGVRLTLRKGDRVVRRDARGAIHVTRVTEDRVEVTDVCRAGPPRSTG